MRGGYVTVFTLRVSVSTPYLNIVDDGPKTYRQIWTSLF